MKHHTLNIVSIKTKQHGITLIEILLALVIFGLAIGYGVQRYQQSQQRDTVNNLAAQASTVYAAMQSARASPGYATNNFNQYLNLSKVFDPKLYNVTVAGTTATVTNARSGGAVAATGATANYTYSETLVDPGVCAGFLPSISPSQYSSVTVGATVLPTPVDGFTAATTCGSVASTVLLTSRG